MDHIAYLAAIGKRIKNDRLKKNLNQQQLAQACGFEKASLSRIESGKTNVTVLTLWKIANALQLEVKDFFI